MKKKLNKVDHDYDLVEAYDDTGLIVDIHRNKAIRKNFYIIKVLKRYK